MEEIKISKNEKLLETQNQNLVEKSYSRHLALKAYIKFANEQHEKEKIKQKNVNNHEQERCVEL